MMPLPPPEPSPVWTIGWPWEVEPCWYYTILEPIDKPTDEPTDNYEELKVRAYWTQLVSSFVKSHDPANIV